MNKRADSLQITDEAAEGLINDESLGAARALIGNKWNVAQHIRDVSAEEINAAAAAAFTCGSWTARRRPRLSETRRTC